MNGDIIDFQIQKFVWNNMNNFAPIVLFVYNRLDHTRKTVEALQKNELVSESELFVYADGPKENASEEQKNKINAVREYVSSITGFKSVNLNFAEKNIGCADSIIRGITEVVNKYGRVIIVEDDIVTNKFFLRFMNEGLEFYESDKRIFTLGSTCNKISFPKNYKYDVFLSCRSVSWGWATWKDRWALADWDIDNYEIIKHPTKKQIKNFNVGGDDMYDMLLMQLNGEIDAWDIRWDYCIRKNNGYTLIPTKSLSYNCGQDGSGVHCSAGLAYNTTALFDSDVFDVKFINGIKPNSRILKSYRDFFALCNKKISVFGRIKRFIKRK